MARRQLMLFMTVALSLFLGIYLILFFDLDTLRSQAAQDAHASRTGKLYLHSIIKMQNAIDDISSDLAKVTQQRDSLLSHYFGNSSKEYYKIRHGDWKDIFTGIEGSQSLLAANYHFGCSALDAVQVVEESTPCGQYSMVQRGFYGLKEVYLVLPRISVCPPGEVGETCHYRQLYHFITELLQLNELNHPSLLHVLGVCVRPSSLKTSTETTSSGPWQSSISSVGYLLEFGHQANITNISHLPWYDRLQIILKVSSLFHYLSMSPLGSLTVRQFTRDMIVILPGTDIRISVIGKLVSADHQCHDHGDCMINGKDVGIKCLRGVCPALESRNVLEEVYHLLFQPLMRVPPADMAEQVTELGNNLSQKLMGIGEFVKQLKKLEEITKTQQDIDSFQQQVRTKTKGIAQPDEKMPAFPAESDGRAWPVGQDSYTYKAVLHADLPNRHDYPCPRSKASWGCVIAVQYRDQAFQRCSGDPQCQAFVVVPHHQKKGWFTVILKTGFSDPSKAPGSILYIKQLVGGPDINLMDKLPEKSELAGEIATPVFHLKPCLDDILHQQKGIRAEREKRLMMSLGLPGISEDQWRMGAKHGVITSVTSDVKSFDLGQAKGHTQGQGKAVIQINKAFVGQALFLAADGPNAYHLAQLGFYHLDRLLGLYRSVPSILRTLEKAEVQLIRLQSDSFPQSFGPLVNMDGKITGVITMPRKAGVDLHHGSLLKKLPNITSTVVPFSSDQQNQLEYMLLLWLSGTPRSSRQLQLELEKPTHFMTWDAFHQGVDDLLQYLYHCQFPRHTVELLWALQEEADDHCTLSSQLLYELHLDGIPSDDLHFHFRSVHQVALLINRAADKLLEIVEQCIDLFGENVVFYNTR